MAKPFKPAKSHPWRKDFAFNKKVKVKISKEIAKNRALKKPKSDPDSDNERSE